MHHKTSKQSRQVRSRQLHGGPKKNVLFRRLIRTALGILGVVIFVFVVMSTEDRSSTFESGSESEIFAILTPSFFYRLLIRTPKPPPTFAAVVVISPESLNYASINSSLSSACQRRIFLTGLLNRLSTLKPAVIVLDMWFPPDSCPGEQSERLWTELRSISRNIRIVTGIGSYSLPEAQAEQPAALARLRQRRASLRPTELVSYPAVKLASENGQITEGVVELDVDNRKIPLSWPIYESFDAIIPDGRPQRIDSLSVAAVRAFNPRNGVLKRLDALGPDGSPNVSRSTFPYTSFLSEEDLTMIPAEDVFCSGTSAVSVQGCDSLGTKSSELKGLSGKIVLIGYAGFGLNDVHKSLIGEVAGVILQANYVESILQNRVYVPLPSLYEVLLGLLWLAVLFSIREFVPASGWVTALLMLVAIIVPLLLLRWGISHFRFYTPLLSAAILISILLFIDKWVDALFDKREEV